MKVPRRPPSTGEIFNQLAKNPDFPRIFQLVREATVGDKYLHWEDLRHQTPPDALTHDVWWFGLKLQRLANRRKIPLADSSGTAFSFAMHDPFLRELHEIDLSAGGSIRMPEQVTNPESRDFYVIRSLMEEAVTSSQLEGAATTREVAKEMIRQGRPPRDRGEKMIVNNYHAMQHIQNVKTQELTKELVFELHRIVTDGALDDLTAAGRLRRDDEYRVVGDEYGAVFHEPPPAEQLEGRMAALCDFANSVTPEGFVHPVVRSILVHFWLAYDHPFVDGNGRTARALFYWSMLHHEYWLFEFVSISPIILKAPAQYGRAFLFTETDENDLNYFIVYHLDLIQRAVRELHAFIERRSRRLHSLERELRGMAALNHRQRELMRHALKHQGYIYTIESHRASHGVVYQTARTDLLDLAQRGLLTKKKVGNAWSFGPPDDLEERLKRTV